MNSLIAFALKHRLLMLGLFIGVMVGISLIFFRKSSVIQFPQTSHTIPRAA